VITNYSTVWPPGGWQWPAVTEATVVWVVLLQADGATGIEQLAEARLRLLRAV